jgi:hypothetical protein
MIDFIEKHCYLDSVIITSLVDLCVKHFIRTTTIIIMILLIAEN